MEAHVGRRAKPEVAPKAFFVWVLVCAFAIRGDSVDLVAPRSQSVQHYVRPLAVQSARRSALEGAHPFDHTLLSPIWSRNYLYCRRIELVYYKTEDASAYFILTDGSQFEGQFLFTPRRV
jgi:hypothetical protein